MNVKLTVETQVSKEEASEGRYPEVHTFFREVKEIEEVDKIVSEAKKVLR